MTRPWQRLLRRFHPPATPAVAARHLASLGLASALELAIVEAAVLRQARSADGLQAWVDAWPRHWEGFDILDRQPSDIATSVTRLRAAGVLLERPVWPLRIAPTFTHHLPHMRGLEARLEVCLDVGVAAPQIVVPEDPRRTVDGVAQQLAEAQGEDVSPRIAAQWASMDDDVVVLAGALLVSAEVRRALGAALGALVSLLSPLMPPDATDRAAVVFEQGVIRFAQAAAPTMSVAWFETPGNPVRREELVRRWAYHIGLQTRTGPQPETPMQAAAALLRVDHLREARFADEAAFAEQLDDVIRTRVQQEKAARERQVRTYAAGRRE